MTTPPHSDDVPRTILAATKDDVDTATVVYEDEDGVPYFDFSTTAPPEFSFLTLNDARSTYEPITQARARARLATPTGSTMAEQKLDLQQKLDEAAASGAPIAIRGDFVIDGQLNISSNTIIDGRGGSITQSAQLKTALGLKQGATQVKVLGLELIGQSAGYVNNGGVFNSTGVNVPSGAGDVLVAECDILKFAGCGVRALPGAGEVFVKGCKIVGPGPEYITSTEYNYSAGLGFSNVGSPWSAEFNDISGYSQGIVTSDGMVNYRIVGNRIHDIPGQHGLYIEQVTRGVIANNVIWGCGLQGMKIQMAFTGYGDSSLVSIHDNVFDDVGSHGILLTRIHSDPEYHIGVSIHDNLIRNARNDGIVVQEGVGVTVHDNVIQDTGSRGIRVLGGRDQLVHHNVIRNAGWSGIEVVHIENFIVDSNIVTNPARRDDASSQANDYGIMIRGASSEGVVKGNRVSDTDRRMRFGIVAAEAADLSTMEFYDNRAVGAWQMGWRATAGPSMLRGFRGNYFEGLQGPYLGKPLNVNDNPNTTGASVTDLEVEVNELKALLRANGLMAP